MRLLACVLGCVLVSCGGGNGGGGAPPPASPGPPLQCPAQLDGPWADTIKGPRLTTWNGGAINDGVYDLVHFVADEVDTRPGHAIGPVRWQIWFHTEQRDAVHQEGSALVLVQIPPAFDCKPGRFAVVNGNELRFQLQKGLEGYRFATMPDGTLVLDSPGGGTMDPKSMVLRHR